MLKPILIAFTLLLLIPNFIHRDINDQLAYDGKEKFEPGLVALNSLDQLEQYIDKAAAELHFSVQSPAYPLLVENIIARRFYHGFSHPSLSENFIAALAEKTIGYGLGCKVNTNEIMKHENAACSQQSMVMMEIFRRKQITYRSVGFQHHYAMEAQVAGNWYYLDANMEPNMTLEERKEINWMGQADQLKKYYDASRFKNLDYQFGNGLMAVNGSINEVPAKNARFFQDFTAILSKIAWCIPLLILAYRSRTAKTPNKRLAKNHLYAVGTGSMYAV